MGVALGLLGLAILAGSSVSGAEIKAPPRYIDVLEGYKSKGLVPAKGVRVVAEGENFVAQGGGRATINQGVGGNAGKSVNWGKNEGSWLEWKFSIPQTGLYNIALKYYPTDMEEKDRSFIIRELTIDGRYPFYEMTDIMLSYLWKANPDEEAKIKRDMEYGDKPPKALRDVVPNRDVWRTEVLGDWNASVLEPYLFYLEAGSHTLRLTSKPKSLGMAISPPQEMELDYILISSPAVLSYKDVLEKYKVEGVKETRNVVVKIQGEDYSVQGGPGQATYGLSGVPIRGGVVYVNAPGLFIRSGAEPEGYYNTLGYWHWPGSWLQWKLTVPEDGLYKIAFKYSQGTAQPIPMSLRDLKIDGEHPFDEMRLIKFRTTGGNNDVSYGWADEDSASASANSQAGSTGGRAAFSFVRYRVRLSDGTYIIAQNDIMKWALYTPSDEKGAPYLFHLKAGEHTIEMRSVVGPELSGAKAILTDVGDEVVRFLSDANSVISKKQGAKNLDVAKEIPGVPDKFRALGGELDKASALLAAFNDGKAPPMVERITLVKEQFESMVKNPNYILGPDKLDPNSYYSFRALTSDTLEILAGLIGTLQAIDVDYIVVASPNVRLRMEQGSFLRSVRKEWVNFINSFKENSD
jgi:hypothetical protein